MINLLLMSILTVTMSWSIKSLNPVKASMGALVTSTILFFLMSLKTGMAWFSILLMMLFMGGIIMMFMILSSILPNEKSIPSGANKTILMAIIFFGMMSFNGGSSESLSIHTNTFLMSGMNFVLMMTMILFYFMSSMSILSAEQTPMRKGLCHQNLIL